MQETIGNYDEAAVGDYVLPDIWPDPPRDVKERLAAWPKRRKEILGLLEETLYGRFPQDDFDVTAELTEEGDMIPGKAVRKQYSLTFTNPRNGISKRLGLLLVLPRNKKPAPCISALNFGGNQTTCLCPEIPLNPNWMRWGNENGYKDHHATDETRGWVSHRWPFQLIVEKGFAVATAYYGDIYPDYKEVRREGLTSLFDQEDDAVSSGSISYWAWGMSVIRKFLATLPEIQANRIFAAGHSRLGKTALWAAANDEGFAGACSNDSGCCGAALSRRYYGEYPQWMVENIPYWFCPGFVNHTANPHDWPVDQHMLLAVIAPRLLQINSAVEDNWADPRGEELSAIHASALYAFLEGKIDSPVSDGTAILSPKVKYHIRSGDHDMLAEDWTAACELFST